MTSARRIFHLIKGLGRGGAEMLLLDCARATGSGSIEHGFGYFLPWKDALVQPMREAGADVVGFDARGGAGLLLQVPRIARHLRRWRADVLHCHLPLAGVAGRLAGKMAGVPVVYTEHNLMERYHPLTRRANLWTWRLQEAVVAVSAEVAASAARHAGDRVPIRVIRNGVPTDRLHPDPDGAKAVRRHLEIPHSAPVVGQVAVFRAQKRLDLWLYAAREILDRRPETRFLLVGDGPLRGEIEALASELGLAEVLRFAGLQEDVGPYLSAMDVLMSSSDFEGLPLVLLEAMALERPVVATGVGGVPEAVIDGETGALVPPGDPQALAETVGRLLDAPGLRATWGRAGRRRVVEELSTDRMLETLDDLYSEVLDRVRSS